MLYFDHCSSTPPHPDVVRTLSEVMQRHYANPASMHQAGMEADKLMQRARSVAAELYRTKPEEWIFTSGGTESNNLAVKGAARALRSRGNHLITTKIEHASVYEAFRALEEEGFEVTYLQVEQDGRLDPARLEQALTDRTTLVSVMQVNNETGAVQPIEQIGQLLSRYPKIVFHVDGVQAVGKLETRIKEWHVDLFSISAHKLQGPKGTGWLYVRESLRLTPLQSGGDQERGLRPGTPNMPAIIAAAKALRLAHESRAERFARMRQLRGRLLDGLAAVHGLTLIDSEQGGVVAQAAKQRPDGVDGEATAQARLGKDSVLAAPHVICCCFPGLKPEVVVHALEERGIIISTKSACSSRRNQPSRVLLGMGLGDELAQSSLRISLGDEHTEQDIDQLIAELTAVAARLKPLARGGAYR